MASVRKVFVPDQEGGGVKSVKSSLFEILLKLASVNGYNLERHIRGPNGYMPGTDVALLTSYALSPDRLITGKAEFVQLLMEAGVPPALIANENMKVYIPGGLTPPPPPPLQKMTAEPRVVYKTPTPEPEMPTLQQRTPTPNNEPPFPPPPPLAGPFAPVGESAHNIPLPGDRTPTVGVKRKATDDPPGNKRYKSYQTLVDVSDDDNDEEEEYRNTVVRKK